MTHGRDHHCVFGRNLNSLSVRGSNDFKNKYDIRKHTKKSLKLFLFRLVDYEILSLGQKKQNQHRWAVYWMNKRLC